MKSRSSALPLLAAVLLCSAGAHGPPKPSSLLSRMSSGGLFEKCSGGGSSWEAQQQEKYHLEEGCGEYDDSSEKRSRFEALDGLSAHVARGGVDAGSDDYSKALERTFLTILAASLFGIMLIPLKGSRASLEFFSGYIVEQSLSVDNIFVFILLFDYFKVPTHLHPLVLSWGIWGAILMRGVMIILGVKIMEKARKTLVVFSAVLVGSGIKIMMEGEEEGDMADNKVRFETE